MLNGSWLPFIEVVQKFFYISTTSVPSEAIFSAAGDLLSEIRSRLIPQHVDNFYFIKMLNIPFNHLFPFCFYFLEQRIYSFCMCLGKLTFNILFNDEVRMKELEEYFGFASGYSFSVNGTSAKKITFKKNVKVKRPRSFFRKSQHQNVKRQQKISLRQKS
jgi:hypothetical protein